ncbi:MAG: hybrid sensor histidine kinase/response regulator [Promethearchaeota archaeon]|nr:MAG: hybrid sensor histidine kinase/response regulator [Candidatus Lokiarchaeota archaeon]
MEIIVTEEDKKYEDTKRIGILISESTKKKWEKFVEDKELATVSRLIRKAVNFYINSQEKIAYLNNLSLLSHDLKEPLTSIKGFSQLIIENHADKLDSEILLRLKEIYAQSMFLEQKINQFLDGISSEGSQYDILIVEDDNPTIFLLSDFFKIRGFSTLGVRTGARAMEEINRSHPKLVLLDIILPDIDGYEICKKIKSKDNKKEIPVFFITAIPESEVVKKIEDTGVDGVLYKPFDFNEFEPLINHLKA